MTSDRSVSAYSRLAERFDAELDALGLERSGVNYAIVATSGDEERTDSYWRFIRAALKWWISLTISEVDAETFHVEFNNRKSKSKPKKRLVKKLPIQLKNDLIDVLRSGRAGRYQKLAADMIEVGIATGLRPVEWRDAHIENDVLIVPNAKFRPGISGNGKTRKLVIQYDVIGLSTLDAIYRVINELNGEEWDVVGGNVRRALAGAKQKLNRMGLITTKQMKTRLYDTRHQFAANAKNSLDYLGGEVAAVMGHRSAETAHISYGTRKKGTGTVPVKPSTDSVAEVSIASISKLSMSVGRVGYKPVSIPVSSPNNEVKQPTHSTPSNSHGSPDHKTAIRDTFDP